MACVGVCESLPCISFGRLAMLGGIFGAVRRDASRYIVQGIAVRYARHRSEACKASERSTKAERGVQGIRARLGVISSPPKFLRPFGSKRQSRARRG